MTATTESLPPSPEVYHALSEYATDLVAILAEDGIVRYASPSFHRILGYLPGEVRGTSAFDHVHPDDVARVQATFRDAIAADGAPVTVQFRYRHANGSWRIIESTGSSHLSDPVIRGFIVNSRDITERVQAEEQLREKEAQYRSIFEATGDGLVIIDLDTLVVVEANPAFCAMYGYIHDEIIGLPAGTLSHPDYRSKFAEHMETIKAGGSIQAHGLSLHKDGTLFHVEAHGTTFTYKGKPHVLGVDRDITERVQAYELLEQRVADRTRELSTLLDVSHNVTSTLELRPLLGLILEQLKAVVDYNGATILTLDGQELAIAGYRGPIPQYEILKVRYAIRKTGINRLVLQRREPAIVDDVRGDSPLAVDYRDAVGDLLDTLFSEVRSWMAVPLELKERVIGMLTLSSYEASYYTPRHAALALAIANQAAVAIENARLYARAQEVAALEERQRLARELHDSVSQALYGIALGTRTARTLLDRNPAQVAEPLEYVLTLAEAGLAEMRALIFELRPEALAAEGLVAALGKQVAAVQARHGIAVEMPLVAEPEAPYEVKEALYRIAQEALHNTVKHANARSVEVLMAWDAGGVVLEVRDDGAGFDPGATFPGHLGLSTMRERATRLGGTLDVDSAVGSGTRILARIPLGGAT